LSQAKRRHIGGVRLELGRSSIMKKITLFIAFLAVTQLVYSQQVDIWGVWNYGDKEDANRIAVLSVGQYLQDEYWRCLCFDFSERWGGWISYEGGGYAINQIIDSNENTVSLYTEISVAAKKENGDFEMRPVKGKVIMHFIDKDHMWLDIDFSDRSYPTDVNFPKVDFKGEELIFWRAERVK
jgi:hypothetical protein